MARKPPKSSNHFTKAGFDNAVEEVIQRSVGKTKEALREFLDDETNLPEHLTVTAQNATYADKAVAARTARETRHRGLSLLPGPVVATRPAYFEKFLTDAGRCTRLKHIATEDIIDLSLVYGNYGNFDAEPNSSIRVRASIEYPSGSFFKAHFTGEDASRDVTITPGGIANTQPIAVRIPKGATFYTNTLVVPVTGGGQYPAGGIIVAGGNANEKCNPASATDYTTTANPGNVSDQFAYGPIAVCAISSTHGKSFGLTGTSISVGTGDTQINGLYEYGFLVRALNWQYGYVHGGSNGESATNWGEASNTNISRHRYRGPLIASCDVVIQEHSTNDFALANAVVGAVQATLIVSWTQLALRGPRVYQCTCPPRTTTTDAWATTVNQTPINARFGPEVGAGSDRQQFNAWLRDGAPILTGVAAATGSNAAGTVRAGQAGHPLTGVIDSAAVVEQFDATTNTWAWKPGYTGDGIHPNTTGHIAMAATVNPALL